MNNQFKKNEDDVTEVKTEVKGGSYKDLGTYYFSSGITHESVKPVIEWILDENIKKRHKELTLIISSYGGYVTAGFALIDAMRGSKIPINTVALGCIASMGVGIFLQGKERILTPNTYVMCHQMAGGNYGKYHELVSGRKEEDWFHNRLVDFYVKCTKLKKPVVEKLFFGPSDTFLTAEEAVKYKLATEIKLID